MKRYFCRIKKLLLTFLIIFINQAYAQVCFSPPTLFSAGTQPWAIVSADFNSDGFFDLALANQSTNNISILLASGTGSFGSAASFTVGSSPYSICSGDFNGDGKSDLAVANSGTNTISVLIGTGTGSFGPTTDFTVGTGPYCVISADFNNDSKEDLAVANRYSNNASILLGTGTGSFSTPTNFSVSNNAISIISGDFDGDTNADFAIITTGTVTPVTIYLGTGTGSFFIHSHITTGYSVISKDFNLDGKSDLAAGDGSGGVNILLATSGGNFGAPITFGSGTNPSFFNSADFDGDGKLDLAITSASLSNISILLGSGTGNFGTATSFTTNIQPSQIISGDFNGNGKIDLATSPASSSSQIAVLINCSAVDIENFSDLRDITISPNPSLSTISLNFKNLSNYQNSTIIIQNTLGQVVKQISFSKTVDVSDLAEGCYFLQIILSTRETCKTKFIKQ